MNLSTHKGCGGTILVGGSGEQAHEYCERCRAFRYQDDEDENFPLGCDAAANRRAWDNGAGRSPDYSCADCAWTHAPHACPEIG